MYDLVYLFGRSLLLWFVLVCERLCVCVPCLIYPRKGSNAWVYYYFLGIIEELQLNLLEVAERIYLTFGQWC